MFTANRVPQLPSTGNEAVDANFRAIVDFIRSLETWGALTIGDVKSWTPVLTFATPGDLSVTYSTQFGTYVKLGQIIMAQFSIITSAFTHTTAASFLQVTGLPLKSVADSAYRATGPVTWTGVTSAYTQINALVGNASTTITFMGSVSAAANGFLTTADVPSGGTPALRGSVIYRV